MDEINILKMDITQLQKVRKERDLTYWILKVLVFDNIIQIHAGLPFSNEIKNITLKMFGVKIGKNVKWGHRGMYISTPHKLTIGENSYLGHNLFIDSCGGVSIGRNVVIARGCCIFSATHDYESKDFSLIMKSIVIGDNVWIGANVTINCGVHIGRNCVIGSCSNILKDMPEGMVCAGNPCRPIKKRFGKFEI